ncbi:hypothetical protein [Mycolicibacterium baixiangningiae]|uniref:hypothetical protein n=1 Tax=Mycolicibacterium baixiangningiae TaxID=2761578 RepID=UPI001E4C8AB1|nr:hypothetical protein [Mycolicibacterium baixiangningiae]
MGRNLRRARARITDLLADPAQEGGEHADEAPSPSALVSCCSFLLPKNRRAQELATALERRKTREQDEAKAFGVPWSDDV